MESATTSTSRLTGGATVYAKDLQKVARFYESTFALQRILHEDDFVALEREGHEIVVVRIPDHIARTFEIASPPARREDSAVKLVFVVESIEAARASAMETGGVIDPPGREWTFRGMRVCDGHDPEGNVVQARARAL